MAEEELIGEFGNEEDIIEEAVPEEVEQESVEDESILTEYDPDDFLSGAVNSLDSTIPLNLFDFEHSYGYNCQKYFNLCACDDSVVCWAAGSIITFLDVNTKQLWFRRSTTGGSVGALTSYRKDPNYRIVIAEGREGARDPIILLYTWPQMDIDAVLRDGTSNAYSVLDFSPDGELLASVGKEPDYNLTIWNWKRHKILLRTSAFSFDVNTVMFSPYCPGQLTTAGAAHIKCWKMAHTFTGLKLKGELGRFGKTEICDVLGVYPMPDEKILSGCEWGNVLVWEAGLVKLEVTQRGRKSCHKAPIVQFMLSPAGDEVTTIARDGYIRAWYWDTVEQADPPEDDPFVELNPVAETYVPGCQIMCLKHQHDMYWYAQDGNGGIWTVDIEIDKLQCNHTKIMTCHASGVVAMAALRTYPILISAGCDGALHAYNTETHTLLAKYQFQAAITCMLYPPTEVDATSRIILVGFADGIMRTMLIHPERLQAQSTLVEVRVHSDVTVHSEESIHADVIDLISLLKPHYKSLTQITINEQRTLLVTCGEDSTIFLYNLELETPFKLHRLGFIQTPNNVAYMTWKPNEERVLLLCGQLGLILEATLPDIPIKTYSEITTFKQEFVSTEEIVVKKYTMRNRPFPTEEDLASIDEEALKAQEESEKDKDDEDEEYIGEIQLEEDIIEEAVPEEVEQESVEDESILTEYDPDDFLSGAVNSLDSTIPLNLFDFEHSYGYNCQKYFNLCACDDSVVCWAAGSIITFLDVNTKQLWFRRSTTGGSVGALTSYRKDPNYRIVIAEGREGARDPIILLYTWPQMDIDAVLRDGTSNAYSVLDFSPDGELLASVGKEPDYNLTIWNWKRHKILLRTSAFSFDVNTVMFSPYCPGQLTTAGAAHIKCWKMAHTFTGLKLKGELGRFGKTEICDVLGVYPMPDEKILSGCEWGNVLVWEAGLVKLEVTQRGRKSCHKAPIVQFMLSPAGDEVTTIARDGYIRAWYWDTVEQADPPEDDPFVELNPVAETYVPGCQIMCLKHQHDMYWYAQDGNGGIWTVDIEIDKLQCNHTKIMTCHASGVVAMAALRTYPILISAGCDGALHAYNTETHTLLAKYQFQAAITCMLYPPTEVDATSRIILVGFADGIMRTMLIHPERLQAQSTLVEVRVHSDVTVHSEESIHADVIDLISLLKPHYKSLTQITINEQRTLLVTCGEDSTIFLYNLELETPFKLHRLGFIQTPNNVAYMTWKPNEERVLLLCGQLGLILEATLPDIPIKTYSEITTFKQEFVSTEEIVVKKYTMRNRPFPTEEDLASIDEEALKAQEESEKDKDDEDEEYIGEIQLVEAENVSGTTITWAQYCDEGIWVVQQDTGALLLVRPGNNKIIKYGPIPGAWCDDITTLKFICEDRYLVLGTNSGYIRVVRMPYEEEDTPEYHYLTWKLAQQKLLKKLKGRRLAKEETQPTPRLDFIDYYYLPIHDRYTGAITCLEFSFDSKYLYTSGRDGNIFSYVINFSEPLISFPSLKPEKETIKVEKIKEPSTVDGELMSHEQLKQKEEYDKMISIANAHKKRVRDQLAELTVEYTKLIKANRALPYSQQMDVTLDPRPLVVQEQELAETKALTQRKLAHQLEASDLALHKMYSRNIIQLDVFPFTLKAIRDPEIMIRPLRQKNLSKAFIEQLQEVHQKMYEASLRGRRAESTTQKAVAKNISLAPPRVASFLLGLPPNPPHPLKKALRNYYQRLNRHHVQFVEWQEHLSRKPDSHALPPGAADALKEAEETIGNRVLKTQPDYVAPQGHNTQLRICLTRKEIYDNKREFNVKVLKLREQKVRLVEKMQEIGKRLAEIRVEIPHKLANQPPPVPIIEDNLEFPEKNLEIKPEIAVQAGRQATTTARKTQERRRSMLYPQPRVRQGRVARFVPITESRPLTASWELLKPKQDQESSPVEIEIRERRIERHLYEQDILIVDANMLVQEFDSRLRKLQRERIRVQEKNQLLELHLYQLHREMTVLNRFEAHEDRLAERVYAKLMQVRSANDQIIDCEQRIEEHKSEKERLDQACQELQRQFKKLVQDNKFADFLRRIFKKKYRPPREKNEDESSESESSSSSSEEEDEGSLDSRDIGPIRLDPNICPEGCDPDIYNKTYELRNTRHKHEQEMLEQDRMVDQLRKDIDAHNKVKRKFSTQLDKRKQELREFMMEKQSCMNEVDQVVILRYDQIRASAIRGCTGPKGLSQTVVFPEKMLSKLRRRVLELQDEIKQQKQRQKVNRTHLFRMNVDLRAMEARAAELGAAMRDVLTRKLGRPRRVDRALDDLLRRLARRHKFSVALDVLPHMLAQLTSWRERHSALEQKYLTILNRYSDRLRLAAALQAEVYPQKPAKDLTIMAGGYEPEQYRRDVIRLRIIRSQQLQQIQALEEEIHQLRLKPLSEISTMSVLSPPESDRTDINLKIVHATARPLRQKYFPITPLSSQVKVVYEVNLMKLLYDCLDLMRVTRDDAEELLQELTTELPNVVSGAKTRFEVVDALVRKWLLKYGGDPSLYKKQTRAFDALATLADRLIKQHVEAMEGIDQKTHEIMQSLESALKDVAGEKRSLQDRLGPALATLMHTTESESEDAMAITMTSLVQSLVDEAHPLTAESIDRIEIFNVVEDLKDCGVKAPEEELKNVVMLAIDCLRAQLVGPEEKRELDKAIDDALHLDTESIATRDTSDDKKKTK